MNQSLEESLFSTLSGWRWCAVSHAAAYCIIPIVEASTQARPIVGCYATMG